MQTENGMLGMEIRTLTLELARAMHLNVAEGVLVIHVTRGGQAWQAVMWPGDVVVAVNGVDVLSAGDFTAALSFPDTTRELRLCVWSKGKFRTVLLDGHRTADPQIPDVGAAIGERVLVESL